MRTGKSIRIFVVCLLMVFLLSGCAVSSGSDRGPYKVWFVAKSTETAFWRSAFAGANAAKSEYNIELTICGPDSEEDYETQNRMIDEAVAAGADAILFSAISYMENAPAIDRAAKAGLRIVVIDSDVASENVNARIGTNNIAAGEMAAEAALASRDGELTVGIVNFDLGSRNGQERETGFRNKMLASGRVADMVTINVPATVESAKKETKELLADRPDINLLVGLNEPIAVGTAEAVYELGLKDEVALTGFDTNTRCIDLMREGSVKALVAQNPYAMGYLGIEACRNLLEGEKYNASEWIDTGTTAVTKEDMFTPENERALFAFE